MGAYYIPRNLKGESRILIIFTVKSLISTAIGAVIGLIFLFIFNLIGLKIIGIIITALLAGIGYAFGAVKIPIISGIRITKNIGGEPLSEIIRRYIKFKTKKKIYIYTKEEK